MSNKIWMLTKVVPVVALAVSLGACEEPAKTAPSASAKAKATVSAPPPPPPPKPVEAKPSHDCPEDSEGKGTFNKPCEAKGKNRIMEVKWNGKIKDKGPTFRIINKAEHEVLYGKIVVYFYDKLGKQMKVGEKGDKSFLSCAGNIFAGAVNPDEKIFVNFSCVKKDDVPDGASAIEGEIEVAGFTGDGMKKADTFWRNKDLTPKERPKGGIKK